MKFFLQLDRNEKWTPRAQLNGWIDLQALNCCGPFLIAHAKFIRQHNERTVNLWALRCSNEIYVNFHGSSLTYRGEKTSLSFKKVSSFQTGRLFSFICFKVFTFEQKSSLSNRNLLFRTEIFSFEQNSFHPNRKILLLRREKQSEM